MVSHVSDVLHGSRHVPGVMKHGPEVFFTRSDVYSHLRPNSFTPFLISQRDHIGVIPPSLVFSGWQKVRSSLPALPLLYLQKFLVQVQTFSDAAMLWRHHPCPALHTHLAGQTVAVVCAGTAKFREQVPNDRMINRTFVQPGGSAFVHGILTCCTAGEGTKADVFL